MTRISITVPDLGGAQEVEVIELLVAPGDTVVAESGLISVESDKSTMEIPSPKAGRVVELTVRVGDRVSEGSLIAVLEVAGPVVEAESQEKKAVPKSELKAGIGESELETATDCDVVVIGAGPGGYSAAFRAADLGLRVVLVERYSNLGGVCLNVGCIPSKALLHVAGIIREASHLSAAGVEFSAPKIDLDGLRTHKETVVANLTDGLSAMAKMRQVSRLQGVARFIDGGRLQVETDEGDRVVTFKRAIIAAGSQPVSLPFLPNDARILDSTGALELPSVPDRMLVIGGGIIGLEMGTVFSSLGSQVDVVEVLDGMMPGADRDLVRVWTKQNKDSFHRLMTSTSVASAEVLENGIRVAFEGENAPEEPVTYDLVLQSVGRRPNSTMLDLASAGIETNEQGFIAVDDQLRTSNRNVFAVGDIIGQPMLAHKAVHEAHIAAEVVAGELTGDDRMSRQAYDAVVIPAVAYTDPEVAWAGVSEEQAREAGREIKVGMFPWSASGRALANGHGQGFTKLIFDAESGRIVGGSVVGAHAGDLIGEVALAIEMGSDAVDMGKTIHPHPTLIETLSFAAEVAEGICTDLPPARKGK